MGLPLDDMRNIGERKGRDRLVSIVVPVYNAEKYLSDTLNSIKGQTYSEYEVILVNDGSTDSSGTICEQYAKEDSRIRVFHNSNYGPAKARNFGIAKASGTYIAFLDSDDLISKDYLEELVKGYVYQEETDLVLCGYERFDSESGITINTNLIGEDKIVLLKTNRELARLFTTPRTSLSGVSIWAKLYKKNIIETNDILFPEDVDYEEDCCFNVQYYRYVRKATVINRCMYRYRQSISSLSKVYKKSTYKNLINGYKERVRFIMELNNPKPLLNGVNVVFLVVLVGNLKKIAHSNMSRKKKREAYDNILQFQETKDVVNSCELSKVNLTRKLTLACRENNAKKIERIMWCWKWKEWWINTSLGKKINDFLMHRQSIIGIITFHFPFNCGAVLQCLALQTFLQKNENKVQIINYRPWYHQNRYALFKNPIYFARKRAKKRNQNDKLIWQIMRGSKGFLLTIRSWIHFYRVFPRYWRFQRFIKRYINETRIYRNLKQLKRRPPKCDLYISGSDQLWNAKITEERIDPAYMMDFGEKGTGKVTYAIGIDLKELSYPEENLKSYMKNISAVSTREQTGLKQVKDLIAEDTYLHVDIDPTLLLDKAEYDIYMCKKELEKEKFILTYTMPNNTQCKVYNAAKLLSDKFGIKVIDISGNPDKGNQKIADNRLCGPDEFLWYMKNASYIVTNSFHGTAFSVIYEKQFMTIPHSITGYRVIELLDRIGLQNRWTDKGIEAAERIDYSIDYINVREKREKLKTQSANYIKMCIKKYGKENKRK